MYDLVELKGYWRRKVGKKTMQEFSFYFGKECMNDRYTLIPLIKKEACC